MSGSIRTATLAAGIFQPSGSQAIAVGTVPAGYRWKVQHWYFYIVTGGVGWNASWRRSSGSVICYWRSNATSSNGQLGADDLDAVLAAGDTITLGASNPLVMHYWFSGTVYEDV